jgi:hypothetical protein
MKYVKILGLLAVAAAALMAFAGTASATYVTTTTGGATAEPIIHAVNEGGHVTLANSNSNIECSSTVEGKVESHKVGKASTPASGKISTLEFTGCTGGWTVAVEAKGELSITSTSGHNGTLTSSGSTVTATLHTFFGDIVCRYLTNGTHIGTVTGGNPATLHIEGSIPFHSGGGLCGSGTAQWTGNYVTTSALYIAP